MPRLAKIDSCPLKRSFSYLILTVPVRDRPPPSRRTPRRIAKRRIDKAARRDNGRPFHTQIGSTIRDLGGKVFVRIVTWITGRCAVRFLCCRHIPDSGGEDVSSLGSSSAEYFGGMAQECVRWLSGRIGPGLAADSGSVTVRAIPARGAPCGRSPFETPFEIVAPDRDA